MDTSRTFVGDLHNFGAAVQKTDLDGSIFYKKPRTTYWENLFFGESSPLKTIFKNTPLFDCFCLREVNLGGESLQQEVLPGNFSHLDFESYGFLVAYCFCMGIQDLHHCNIVPASFGAQPIDVEVVFSNLISPSQTLLVPGSNIEFSRSGLGCFFQSQDQLSEENILALIRGFYSGVTKLLSVSDEILQLLPCRERISCIHNRVIFRSTKQYFEAPADLFLEEKVQLERGDIPYFFKTGKSSKVFYFKTKNKAIEVVGLPSKFKKIADTIGWSPEIILSKDRLRNKTLPIGTLSLVASFLGQLKDVLILNLPDACIEIKTASVVLTSDKKYELRISR